MARVPREKSSEEQQQISVMLPVDWVERLDAVAENLSEPGVSLKRADVLRMAIRRGLEALESTGRPKR
jgi:predicted DNA-binding protein